LFECAVSSTAGFAELNIAVGPGRAHGVSSLGNTREAVSRIAAFGFTSKSLTVQTRTLDEILREVGAPPGINFVSIDVEGHELEVLKGLSLGEWKPVILVIEDNSNFESEAVSEHLAGFGYVRFNRTGVNDWYAHCSNKHLVTKRRLVALRWKSLRARAESRLQRIPGLVYIVRKLRGT
jgi:FkbM family methyltransferase